ncbi:Smr/MutS family protein [Paraburkholderia humisilvae]|uniref:Endonuclease MutS2 n=1 Tax=Paraburkholderia humisilvae TaxID=627669 RepID=A0A6J5CWE4_9BURK|nr:Smr/MutS family protein [Paraburkholderia humisilvae]CAB3745893.1 Endonuclease MutS2 [Paraburkholderia humisilvae]
MPKNRPHPSDAKPVAKARVPAPPPAAPIPPTLTRGAGLTDLGTLRDALKHDARRRERETTQAKEAKRAADADAEQFRRELGEVTPLGAKPRATLTRTPPTPLPVQTRLDEAAVLNEAISDEFDPEMLLDTDESLFYCRPGINQEVVRKLRRGAWIVQAQLDLHGMRRDEARQALAEFIRDSGKRGLRCLRVIHGKGLGSIGKEPVLKGRVRAWLVQKEEVIAFCQARPHDGGAGAVLVLLQPGATPPQPKN